MLDRFRDKNVLLLQGPLGPFFKRFSVDLHSLDVNVFKINLCGGDQFFYSGSEVTRYVDTLENWLHFLDAYIVDHSIDAIFLLGDCRPYHSRAIEIAQRQSVDVYVFEEGYLRPDFITLERDGVNGNSPMLKEPDFYRNAAMPVRKDLQKVGKPFWRSAVYAMMYYTATSFWTFRYPNYVHHRDRALLRHIGCWLRGAVRKYYFRVKEASVLNKLTTEWANRYFLFPLQVHNDFQFKHARYEKIEDCIEEVFKSFAECSPADHLLVLKHHPADRPYRDYTALIKTLSAKYHVQDRVRYVHDLHLPTLLKNAKGTILMNSTVGLASLHYQTPVKVLGQAIYHFEGLSFGGELDAFWENPGTVDMDLYFKFRGWLEHNNQINGNYYMRIKNEKYVSGVDWDSFNPVFINREN